MAGAILYRSLYENRGEGPMIHFILRRLLTFIPMLLLISIVAFTIIQLPPGSFVENRIAELANIGGDPSSMAQIDQIKARYGLDRPLWTQYFIWIRGILLHGDFGEAFAYNKPVGEVIWGYMGYTLLISSLSFVLVYLIAVPLGVFAAIHRYDWPGHLISAITFIGMSLPGFLLALCFLVVGLFYLDHAFIGIVSPQYQFKAWDSEKIWDLMKHLPLPAFIVAVNGSAGLVRIMRGNLLDVLGQQYIRTAMAKGLPRRSVIVKHALRMAINPLISIIGMSLPSLFSGSAIVSIVLNLPTAEYLLYESLKTQDMYLAGALILMLSFILLVGNLIADVALAWADPRIRYD
jgi:peptide/nickel transport system permease protein